jgi:hypothetical protein
VAIKLTVFEFTSIPATIRPGHRPRAIDAAPFNATVIGTMDPCQGGKETASDN